MIEIVIQLAGEPCGKGRPRFVRSTGHAFTPAKTRNYASALRFAAQQRMGNDAPLAGALAVTVDALFVVPGSWSRRKRELALSGHLRPTKKPDADNLLKQIDALNQVVWLDDKQIVQSLVRKFYSEKPSLTITVKELYQDQ